MSRGRGRGGRGANKSFSREQLTSLGITGNELVPGPVTQPPPLFPMLIRRPIALQSSVDTDYLLLLKQDLIDHMNLSVAYLKMPDAQENTAESGIESLIAQLPRVTKEKFDWSLFPTELRPKMAAKRANKKKVVVKTEIDIENRLAKLEQMESKTKDKETTIKTEVEDEELPEEDYQDDEEDEEMDDGTDYANNYFDNGEAYEDEDDNLDDGPIY